MSEMAGSFDDVIRLVMIEVNKAIADGTSIESGVRTALFPVLVGPVPDKKPIGLQSDDQMNTVAGDSISEAVAAGWIRHDGGECPVGPKDRVHFRTQFNLDNPNRLINEDVNGREADTLRWVNRDDVEPWNDNIVVYKVVK
ncbi:hypothetical protein [Mesorhizobium sp.]|uniref:hypothetical protein n=1 Tax=Mesorhizobium sp. TaxID=1871066 RepID=UPI000FE8FF9C|nr:hypothetical protein [Mesorhizobium sp.]RWF33761.1 MAG: hypothetical protein EOS45_02185 [Mesorhizobium sp.]